jgi:uncharacterized HAD superfamily protein/orotate phosphoribosyltransferase
MIYKSIADLAATVSANLYSIPADEDLIVCVPLSGLLAASVMALQLNCKLCDLSSFCANAPVSIGLSRRVGRASLDLHVPSDAGCVLVIYDSAASGKSIDRARLAVEQSGYGGKVLFCAVYATEESRHKVDIACEVTPLPRIFEWNLFHRRDVERYCVDIDGVLCRDPLQTENDDGDAYTRFILDARTLARPTYRVGHLVTSRLEKYRPQTERWLHANGIEYGELHMLDVPSAAERRRLNLHASFKASVYARQTRSMLFIESETAQAREICRRTGKPVLDYSLQTLIDPGNGLPALMAQSRGIVRENRRRLRRIWKKLVG